MGRRKQREAPALPSTPVRLADALLYAEEDIKKTIQEERRSLSLIGTTPPDGSAAGKGKPYSDRTAAAAIKLADGLPCVVLEDGRTVRKPEKWLSVFEAVREKARQCKRPGLIFDTWAIKYQKEIILLDSKDASPRTFRHIKSWIRYQVLTEARAAGLVDFDENEIMDDVEKTSYEWLEE